MDNFYFIPFSEEENLHTYNLSRFKIDTEKLVILTIGNANKRCLEGLVVAARLFHHLLRELDMRCLALHHHPWLAFFVKHHQIVAAQQAIHGDFTFHRQMRGGYILHRQQKLDKLLAHLLLWSCRHPFLPYWVEEFLIIACNPLSNPGC